MQLRRVAAAIVFALLFLGGVQPYFVKLLFRDTSALAESLAHAPDAQTPTYPAFLERVRGATKNGDSILIIVPMRHWDEGYSYAYYRASYFLAGRRTVPIVNAEDALIRDNVEKADYVASWRVAAQVPGFETVWRDDEGMLLRRTR